MSAAGQTINDRILAARHSLAGQVGAMIIPVTLAMAIMVMMIMVVMVMVITSDDHQVSK